MPRSGKTPKTVPPEAFDFPLVTKRNLEAQRRQLVLAHSESLRDQFQQLRGKINWDALRQASTDDEVNAALSGVDQYARDRLPNAIAILATVRDPKYPKIRPICFLAASCALALQTNPKSVEQYSPRYSRDVCYQERKGRHPAPRRMTNLEFWIAQAKLGQKVPVKYLRKINKLQAKEQAPPGGAKIRTELTYVDIHGKMGSMKKRRTTVWLTEKTIEKLRKLSATTGAPMAELFRRAVDAYLKRS
jgi:hypothetical protein